MNTLISDVSWWNCQSNSRVVMVSAFSSLVQTKQIRQHQYLCAAQSDENTYRKTYLHDIHTSMHAYIHTCIQHATRQARRAKVHTPTPSYMYTSTQPYMHAYVHTCIHDERKERSIEPADFSRTECLFCATVKKASANLISFDALGSM